MQEFINVTGIVLKQTPIGEYDRRICLLTKEKGKISAFARGARKPGNRLSAATNPFSFGQFKLYAGRDSYTISEADIQNYFPELMSDYVGAYYGMYFAEVADYYTRENNDERQMMKLLYQSLRALTKKSLDRELVRYIYELKIFTYAGEYPEVFHCTQCGSEEKLKYFSMFQNGMVCEDCKVKAKDGLVLHPSTVYTMQYIISTEVERLYTFTVSAEVLAELRMVMDRWRERYLDKTMKSLEILESVKDIC